MFNYNISVNKTGVDFIATKGNVRHEQSLSHSDSPRAIKSVFSKVSDDTLEQEFLYEAIKMFKATNITIKDK